MAKQVYTYSSFPIAPSESHPRGFSAQRPLIYATVTASNGEAFDWAVLLDSGADNCLFPLRLASYLNLDVTAMPRTLTGGVGSKANVTYFDHLRIDLGKGIAFTAYVGFTEGMDAMAIGLLGQDGFFDQYNVDFRNADGIFAIEAAVAGLDC
jgi:hypothetical protein